MLQAIRDKFTGGIALAMLALIAVPFAFFGITDYNFLGSGYAAKVGDAEISIAQLENAFQNQMLQNPDYGDLPAEYRQILKRNVLERLIRDVLIEQYVADEGFRIGDNVVTDMIQSAPQFQADGVFQKELYYTWLDQTAQNVKVFEAQQRQSIRISQLQRGLGATAFVTPSEYRRYLNLFAEQREISLAVFDVAALADTIVVNDEDAAIFYEARPTEFMLPETVDFEYLEISRAQLSAEAEVSAEALQQYYEDSSGRFQQDEQRQAAHILITFDDGDDAAEAAAQEEAKTLAIRAQAGEPFADLARQYSKDGGTAEQGGDLGIILQSQMPGALGDAIFSMGKDEILGPVKSAFGFHVIKLDAISAGGPLPFDQVSGELEQELRDTAASNRYRELERALADAMFDASDLQSMTGTTGLEVQSESSYTRAGGGVFGANQAVIEAIFDPRILDDKQLSAIIEVDADRSIGLQVSVHHEASRQSLEVVREQIRFSLQSERALNIIQDRSRRLREALEAGQQFSDIAFQLEAQYTPSIVVDRVDAEMDRDLLNAVFTAKKPSAGNSRLGSTVTSVGDYAVFLVNAVVPGRPESIPLAERDARKDNLQSQAGAADLNAFVSELERRADIERNEDAFNQQDLLF
jgi:peptidyl-prolyl cis-trans isomerase D